MPRGVKLLLVLALVVVMIAVGLLYYLFNVPRFTVKQIQSTLAQTAPIGKELPAVIQWLDAHPELQKRKEIRDPKTGTLTAIQTHIPEVGPRWGHPARIDVELQLEKDKLAQINVQYRKTSQMIGY